MPRLVGKISRVSDVHALRFQKVKGTIVDFNELERALDDLPGLGAWQIELRKAHDDPLDLDELNLHVARTGNASSADLERALREKLHAHFEITPNKILFHSAAELRALQKVGVALKEQKVVDRRDEPRREEPVREAVRPSPQASYP